MKIFEKFLFAISFLIAFIGILKIVPLLVLIVLIIAGLTYLFLGWFLLLPEKGKIERWLPFVVSYLIAQTLIAVLFGINEWPMKDIFSYFTIVSLIVAIIGLFVAKKSLSEKYPVNQYLTRLIVCFMFSCSPIWMHVI